MAIAFHSGYGHTAVIAEAVARGAADAGAEVISVPVEGITASSKRFFTQSPLWAGARGPGKN